MSRIVTVSDSLTAYPSGYNQTDGQWYSISDVSNAYTDSSSTTYCTISMTRGVQAETWIYWTFDTSSIPSDATIVSASISAKGYGGGNNTSVPTKNIGVFYGDTQFGSTYGLGSSTPVRTWNIGSLTAAQIKTIKVRLYAKRGNNGTTNYVLRMYGATLTVSYTYNEVYYTVTASSTASGISVSPSSQEYLAGSNASVSISGDMTDATVTDNGNDVTASVTGSGTSHTYTILAIAADHAVLVEVPSSMTVYYKRNGTWVLADGVYYKQNGSWVSADSLYVKENGTWKN